MSLKGEIVDNRGCCSVEWKIENFFSNLPKTNEYWISPTFYLSDALWCMEVYPNGQTCDKSTGWVCLYLIKMKSKTKVHEVSFILGAKASDGTEVKSLKYTSRFDELESGYGKPKMFEWKELTREKKKLFPDGAMTFFCKARLIGAGNRVDAESQTESVDDFDRLTRDLKDLLRSEEDGDMTIKVKDREFRVHSQILGAQCSVFGPMFRHDMKKNNGVVEIPECDPDAFRELLIFLYCGETGKLCSQNVNDLYWAADKYDFQDLKTECSKVMKEEMSVDSFCDVLSVAITYSEKELLDFATDFFIENMKKIIVTIKWMTFIKIYPTESNELFIKAANKFIPE